MITKKEKRLKRKLRIRARLSGTVMRPRFAVYRSNSALYVQVVDDTKAVTIMGKRVNGKSIAIATALGISLAEELLKKGIKTVVFDRGGYRFHGAVRALAQALRDGGITI